MSNYTINRETKIKIKPFKNNNNIFKVFLLRKITELTNQENGKIHKLLEMR